MAGSVADIQGEPAFPDAVPTAAETPAPAGSNKSIPLVFHFTWQGMDFDGEVRRIDDESGAILTLSGKVGVLPFTVENVFVRKIFLDRYRSKGFALGGSLRLSSGSAFELVVETRLPPRASPADVVKAVVACLLAAKNELAEINSIPSLPS